jgi:hypothetical protein
MVPEKTRPYAKKRPLSAGIILLTYIISGPFGLHSMIDLANSSFKSPVYKSGHLYFCETLGEGR